MLLKQVPEDQWNEIAVPFDLAVIAITPEILKEKYKIEFFEYYDDGLGEAKACVIDIANTLYWLVTHFDEPEFMVSVLSFTPNANDALENIIKALSLTSDTIIWQNPNIGKAVWVLFRVDDNGNEIEMYRFLEQNVAEHLKSIYENKGHKQAYFVTKKA